ncbi:hypothetical protein [Vulcaniibacterium gelatinicum]|uniref:hypothetical protein n=1 Tax=Vulcaniibacterium gelatinicum TaxID=2598725 RepID=UPI0011CC8193|nr:hypothetical protein [Vulcaniibacterium gelatinicum]
MKTPQSLAYARVQPARTPPPRLHRARGIPARNAENKLFFPNTRAVVRIRHCMALSVRPRRAAVPHTASGAPLVGKRVRRVVDSGKNRD